MDTSRRARTAEGSLPAAYRRAVALFEDWYTATGHVAMPASWETVAEFVDAAGYAPATRRVQVAAIAAAHRAVGCTPPVRPPAMRRSPSRPDVTAVLAGLPQRGWPGALSGRRDALLLALWAAGATLPLLAGLTVENIDVTRERTLAVTGLGALPAAADPAVCPACIWLRWRPVHSRIVRWRPPQPLKDLLATGNDDAPTRDTDHRCEGPAGSSASGKVAGAPLFPALDRWGNPAEIGGRAMTGRGLHGILATRLPAPSRRLLHEQALPDGDRVAGLLVLLYGQTLSRIIRLTGEHVTHSPGGVQLLLGESPVDLPEAMQALVQRIATKVGRHAPLFPGREPGRAMSSKRLRNRLAPLGIEGRIGRNTALIDLTADLPPTARRARSNARHRHRSRGILGPTIRRAQCRLRRPTLP